MTKSRGERYSRSLDTQCQRLSRGRVVIGEEWIDSNSNAKVSSP